MTVAGFSLVEEGHMATDIFGLSPELKMLARLHVYQIYKINQNGGQ
jgi:hypothetical protein